MKIAVCIKQVPLLDSVRFNPKTKRVVRDDVATATNPLDLLALGHGLALRDAVGGTVTVITMGPPNARACLEDALARGADRAVLLSDRRFAGADTLATVRALRGALQGEGFDLVLLGRSTLDGATAQVAPQLAELLGVPQVTQATDVEADGDLLRVTRETDDGSETLRLPLPGVVSVLRGPAPPEASDAPRTAIQERSAEDLGGGPRDFGTRGSPTFVRDVRALPETVGTVALTDVDAAAEALARHIAAARTAAADEPLDGASAPAGRVIWALAERLGDGRTHPISHEAIACGRSVARAYDARVVSVLLCASAGDTPSELLAHGADGVLVVEDPQLETYATEPFTAALCAAIERFGPDAVIGPWTADGRDFVPRASARLGLGLTGDFIALEVADADTDDPDLLWIKPAWSGTVEAPVIAHTTPAVGTLRPGAVAALGPDPRREGLVEVLRPGLTGGAPGAQLAQRTSAIADDQLVDCATVLVSVGADADERLVELARQLAGVAGGAVAASGEAVAKGLLPPQCEVGILRRSVSPRLFVALGHHAPDDLAAASRSEVVVTVGAAEPVPPHSHVDLAIAIPAADVVERLLAVVPQAA